MERAVSNALGGRRSERLNPLSDRFADRLESSSLESVSRDSLSCACSICKGETSGSSSILESTSNLEAEALVSASFGDITKGYIDWNPEGDNTTLTYTVFDRESENFFFTSLEHTVQEEALIDETFAEVDPLIELDFEESDLY